MKKAATYNVTNNNINSIKNLTHKKWTNGDEMQSQTPQIHRPGAVNTTENAAKPIHHKKVKKVKISKWMCTWKKSLATGMLQTCTRDQASQHMETAPTNNGIKSENGRHELWKHRERSKCPTFVTSNIFQPTESRLHPLWRPIWRLCAYLGNWHLWALTVWISVYMPWVAQCLYDSMS